MLDRYSYRVVFSDEDQEWVGLCAEFPSLSHLDEDKVAALEGIAALVRDVVEDMESNGEAVPQPFSSQQFSGRFVTRVTTHLHRALVVEAAEAGVSLNKLVNHKLSMPAPIARPPKAANSSERKPRTCLEVVG